MVDTDAANEIDDQFALTYAVLRRDRLAIEAVYAAPFQRFADPGAQAGKHGRDPADPEAAATPAQGMAAEPSRDRASAGRARGRCQDRLGPPRLAILAARRPGPRSPAPPRTILSVGPEPEPTPCTS